MVQMAIDGSLESFLFNFYLLCLDSWAGKQESICSCSVLFAQFFHSVCVSERVEGVLTAGFSWRNIGYHDSLTFWAHEGVFKDLS